MTDIQFNPSPDPEAFALKSKQMDLEAGILGRFFGAGKSASFNISGLVLILLIGLGAYLYISQPSQASEYWKLIIPILTGIIGFLFGKTD